MSYVADVIKNYFESERNVYDVRQKGHVTIPPARSPLDDKAVRIHGVSLCHKSNASVISNWLQNSLRKKWRFALFQYTRKIGVRGGFSSIVTMKYEQATTHFKSENPVLYCCNMLLGTSSMGIPRAVYFI